MASTDDYIQAIEDKRDKGQTAQVDFSKMPPDVDQEKIYKALSKGLPDEYSKEIENRYQTKSPISLNYGIIHVKQSVPDKVWDTIKEPVMGALKQVTSPKEIAKAATAPIPGLAKLGEKADVGLSKAMEKISPTEEEIVSQSEKTGEVPYGKIAERTAAQTLSTAVTGMIPRTPMDLAMYAVPLELGISKPLETGASVVERMGEGKTLAQAAKELGVPEEAAQKALDAVKGAQETTVGLPKTQLTVIQPGAKTGAPHALFSYNDNFGEGGKARSIYTVFGDPEDPKVKAIGYGSSVTKEQIDKAGIQITGREPRTVGKWEPIEGFAKAPEPKVKIPSEPIDNSNHALVAKALEGDQASMVQAMKQAYEKFIANHRELTNNVGEIIGYQLNPSEASSTAHNLFDRRFGDIGLGHFESQLFRREATRNLSDIEKQAIPFVIEGKIPTLERFKAIHPDAEQILEKAQNPTDAMKMAVAKIGPYYKEGHEFLSKVNADIGFRENYVNRIWKKGDGPGPAIGAAKQSLSEWNPFSNRRYIGSLAEGINMGKVPETTDIDHLIRVYDDFKIKTVANAKFAESLKDLDVLKTPDKAPSDWVKLTGDKYKALQRKVFIPGKEKGDPGFFMYRPMAVHPDYVPAIDAIVTKPFSNAAIRGLELFNAAYKKSLFSFSLFHHFTLGTIDIAAGGNPFRVAGESIAKRFAEVGEKNPFKYLFGEEGALNRKNLYKSFMDGHAAFDNVPIAKDAIQHGLNVNPLSDAQVGRIRGALVGLEERMKNTPVVGQIAKAAVTYDKIFDKTLWDYLHAGVKMDLYQRHLEQNLKAFPNMAVEDVKRQTAEFVNNAAGGALDGMMLNPKFQQTLHWAMMAPDFFLTRLHAFASMFKGGPIGFQARKMWLKAAVAYYSTANTINYINTKKAYGKGQFMWENDKDHQITPFLEKIPSGPQAGRQQFLKLDKALTEPIEFLMNPKKVLGNKFSPYANALAVYWTGHTMSGYKPQDEGPMDFLKQSIPMSLRGQSLYGVFPKISGMSKSTIATEYAKAFDNKDDKKMKELATVAARNGYNPNHLKQAVRRILLEEKKKAMQQ